jgi:Mlc titration factor MtfA (ptsG expression regulator)
VRIEYGGLRLAVKWATVVGATPSVVMWNFFSKARRRQSLLEEPFYPEWREILERNVAVYGRLSADEQSRLERAVQVIVNERSFEGLRGMEISDEVCITIAGQAALMLLGDDGYYFDRVGVILVQERIFHTRTVHPLGGVELVQENVPVSGLASHHGEIRLAWDQVLAGGRDPDDGYNVVIHEFAHHLDRLDGEMNGVPPLASDRAHRHWCRMMAQTMDQLIGELRQGAKPLLPAEAADNPAELFAYATEHFFELPRALAEHYPSLFDCLLGFYEVDPRAWSPA